MLQNAYDDQNSPAATDWWSQNAPPPPSDPGGTVNGTPPLPGARDYPGPTGTSGPPTGGSLRDPIYARQLVDYYANQPGANSSLKRDPEYWVRVMTTSPEWATADQEYAVKKFMQPEGAAGGLDAPGAGGLITDPFNEPFNAPPPVDLGGPAGIPYVPQTPDPGAAPTPNLPTYTPPAPWKPPSVEDALNDPGYQFRTKQGEDSLQHWAAARGTLNDSGTGKALIDYGQGAASSEYQNVWNRGAQGYQMNVQSQNLDPYKFSYQAAMDTFAPQMTAYAAKNNAQNLGYSTQAASGQQQTQQNYSNAYSKWLDDWKMFTENRDSTWNKQFQYANT